MTHQETQKSFCNRCKNMNKHIVRYKKVEHESEEIDEGFSVEWAYTYYLLECSGCEELSFCKETFWPNESVDMEFYPPRVSRSKPIWFDQLPEEYQEILSEIYSVLHMDNRRLAMMGARCVIDLFITRKVGDQGRFDLGMKMLEAKGYISNKNAIFLKAAVEIGHASAHRGHKPTITNVNSVIDIVENLLQQGEVLSNSAKLLKKSTPRRKRLSRRAVGKN